MTNARELTSRLADLLSCERSALADFLVLLADFDKRRLWLDLGHASLFSFLHRELRLSRGAAYYRQAAVGLVQRYPEIVEPIRDGRLCITSLVELAKVITPENRREVLPRFFHCSKQEAAEVAAAIRPQEDAPHRTVVTAVPAAAATTQPVLLPSPAPALELTPPAVQLEGRPDANSRTQPQPERSEVQPLTADLRRLHVTVSREFLAKLGAARDALSHSHPDATDEEILAAGLDLLLARDARRKGLVERPRTKIRASNPQHVPAHVRRAVWKRDGGCCSWRLDSGGVCGSTRRLQFDHVTPPALGGASTVENVRLLCATHNVLSARRVYGDACMDRYTRRASQVRDGDVSPSPAASSGGEP
ncbi:MAG TPA: HNH endonuclease signature motif containing protein [Anaeromyxobacter sp.]|nr:HNH endonuclease signature motif containing protein [Anaeromyxobacter sp.]